MNKGAFIPRILIVDDVFGRTHPYQRNEERANLCGQYLFRDITGDEPEGTRTQTIKQPLAEVVYCRGQNPHCAQIGDTVENDIEGVLRAIHSGWDGRPAGVPPWTLVLLDLCFLTGKVTSDSNRRAQGMPKGRPADKDPEGYFGLHVLRAVQEELPELPVIILSSMPRDAVSREYAYRGGLDFLPRENAESPGRLREDIWYHGLIPDEVGEIVGCSTELLLALRAARRISRTRQHVLIRGERGTGKELLAGYINRQSSRGGKPRPLVTIDSGMLSPELFRSELFGHEKGAYTGADKARLGRIVDADGGDLFLDEIGNMPTVAQAGLLRVLETGKVIPLGTGKEQAVDLRVLSATNGDIEGMTVSGRFQKDLLDRLRRGGTIYLPPLRHRREDVSLLVEKFLREAEQENPKAKQRAVDPDALEMLCAHDWQGNIRELRDCVGAAVTNYPDNEYLVPTHLGLRLERGHQGRVHLDGAEVAPPDRRAGSTGDGDAESVDQIIRDMLALDLDSPEASALAQRLPKLQGAYAQLVARYLKAALEVTRRPTVENPEGRVQITPAMKLITGDAKLTTDRAADLIKRLLAIRPGVIEDLLEDPVIREAHETALRLRPRGRKKKPITRS
ncbi:MAG: sigma-54-dependent Fis family transcriptional regulator [Candidatus Eisenbacteria sp.]|nr:sigma-54-dependent Fis family transcriptional regulator [Candidatus Eisenbacteria bacterium]